ncbi:hypothetical protein ACFFK0_03840 [Paenibacillus chartarius]|uniref:Uncharacterized protein n=1 Tax=Paenibacillus chartarius TaxID=747481 RepID=A0ABV6DG12_9BACL
MQNLIYLSSSRLAAIVKNAYRPYWIMLAFAALVCSLMFWGYHEHRNGEGGIYRDPYAQTNDVSKSA